MRVKWKHVRVYMEIVLILTQDRYTVCPECTIRLGNQFGRTRWNSEVTWVIWNITFGSFADIVSVGAR
jgi:hypothetical protein